MSQAINLRELVMEVLLKVEREQCRLNETLHSQLLKYQYMDKTSRAFVTRLCEGTMEYRLRLDYVINQISKTPVNKCKPFIRVLLRMSVYQIMFMDNIPDAAACNEAVKLAKQHGFSKLSGFVNGVLRNLARTKQMIVYPDCNKQPEEYMSIYYSIPKWLIHQWREQYGSKTAECMAAAVNEKPPTTLRVNTMLCSKEECMCALQEEGAVVREIEGLQEYDDWFQQITKQAFVLEQYDYLAKYKAYKKGWFAVQDASSMFPGIAAVRELKKKDSLKDVFIMDVCAAPGGKTAFVASYLNGQGQILARDVSEEKVAWMQENVERLCYTNVQTQVQDALVMDELYREKADIVICDAPCSGLGVIGRKKEIRYRMTMGQERELEELQRQILSVVKQYVKPNGLLLYSTCTVNQGENHDNTEWFLKQNPEYICEEEVVLLPGKQQCDGFYLAALRRSGIHK